MAKNKVQTLDLNQSAEWLNAQIEQSDVQYVLFAEEGAKLSADYAETLAAKLDDAAELAMAQGLLKVGKKPLSLHRPYQKESLEFDVEADFSQALLYPHGVLVRAQELKSSGVRFNPAFEFVRDHLFALQLCAKFPRRWFDGSRTYTAKDKLDEFAPNGPRTWKAGWYWESTHPLFDLLKEDDGSLSKANQHAFMYLAAVRFLANSGAESKSCFEGPEDSQRYIAQVSELLKLVCDEVLMARAPLGGFVRYDRCYFAGLRNDGNPVDLDVTVSDGKAALVFANTEPPVDVYNYKEHNVQVQNLNVITEQGKKFLKIDMRFKTFAKPSQYKFLARVSNGAQHQDAEFKATKRFSGAMIYFCQEVLDLTSLVAKVPLYENGVHQTVSLVLVACGQEFPMPFKYMDLWNARLQTSGSDAPYWSVPGYIVRDKAGVIDFEPAGALQKIKQELSYWKWLKQTKAPERFVKLRKAYWLTRPYFKHKRIWIYYDKVFKAGDNADFAYAYAMKQNDGIEKYYFLDNRCADWDRLEKAGYKLLLPKTLKGDLYTMNAELIYVTHNPALNRPGFRPKDENYVKTFFDPTCIRLFHGFPNNRNQTYNQTYQNYAGVVVCSEYERQLYGSPANEYAPEQIIPCSNPRFDELEPDNQRWLVFAPTWRPTLRGKGDKGDHSSGYNPEFKESRYFRMYNQVLTSERFLETARRTGYKVKVFLHPRLAPQTVDFENNDVVQGLDSTKDMTYVEMMRQADLMVTDYSSVQYDFASMHKPVVYYHDPTIPYWRVVEFDYENLGFGEICMNPQELEDVLCAYMENDCRLSDKYEKRISDFFLKPNGTASKELYEATRKITG